LAEKFEKISSSKTEKNPLSILHLCGNGPKCYTRSHLHIGLTKDNNTQTHCHYIMRLLNDKKRKEFVDLGFCPHSNSSIGVGCGQIPKKAKRK